MTFYFLHVDIIIESTDRAAFEETVSEFLIENGFARISPNFSGTLTLALRSSSTVPFVGYGNSGTTQEKRIKDGAQYFRYVHLWRLPTLADLDLGKVMTQAADDALYRRLNDFVLDEQQQFLGICPETVIPPPAPRKDTDRYVRFTELFQTSDLAPYLFGLGTCISTLTARPPSGKPWCPQGAFQSITGQLNSVVEFWCNQDPDPVAFDDRFKSIATTRSRLADEKLTPAPKAASTETFVPAPYCPPSRFV